MKNLKKVSQLTFSSKYAFKDWFFYIDHKGLIYLEDTVPKNFTTCLKDQKFLKNFYANMTKNKTDRHQNYPYLSKCWGEYNFVRCHTEPVIFTNKDTINGKLIISCHENFSIEFAPSQLRIDAQGVLYHKIQLNDIEYGVFSTELSLFFSDCLKVLGNQQKFLLDI